MSDAQDGALADGAEELAEEVDEALLETDDDDDARSEEDDPLIETLENDVDEADEPMRVDDIEDDDRDEEMLVEELAELLPDPEKETREEADEMTEVDGVTTTPLTFRGILMSPSPAAR